MFLLPPLLNMKNTILYCSVVSLYVLLFVCLSLFFLFLFHYSIVLYILALTMRSKKRHYKLPAPGVWLRSVPLTSEESNRARQWQHGESHDCTESQPVGRDCVVLQSIPLEQKVVTLLQEREKKKDGFQPKHWGWGGNQSPWRRTCREERATAPLRQTRG